MRAYCSKQGRTRPRNGRGRGKAGHALRYSRKSLRYMGDWCFVGSEVRCFVPRPPAQPRSSTPLRIMFGERDQAMHYRPWTCLPHGARAKTEGTAGSQADPASPAWQDLPSSSVDAPLRVAGDCQPEAHAADGPPRVPNTAPGRRRKRGRIHFPEKPRPKGTGADTHRTAPPRVDPNRGRHGRPATRAKSICPHFPGRRLIRVPDARMEKIIRASGRRSPGIGADPSCRPFWQVIPRGTDEASRRGTPPELARCADRTTGRNGAVPFLQCPPITP